MNTQIYNLGKVSITVEKDYWNITKCYDKLVVVEREGDGAYLSRKPVPSGTSIYNRNYWIRLGGSNTTSNVILEATITPDIVTVGVTTTINILVQVSSLASEIRVFKGTTQVGVVGQGTQHTVTDTVTPTSTEYIFYTVQAIVNGQIVERGFEVLVNSVSAPISWSTTSYLYLMSDENPVLPTLINSENLEVEYQSTNTNVITVNSTTGAITLVAEGNATIRAFFAGNDNYQQTIAELNIIVRRDNYSALVWKKDNTAITSDTVIFGASYVQPIAYNPLNKPISYSSSNTNVATIDSNGNISIVGVGTCIIWASFSGDNIYAETNMGFTLVVTEQQMNVFVGVGDSYSDVVFTDTGEYLHNNMVINVSPNNEYIFIKVGINDTITSFKSYFGPGSNWNFDVALDDPIPVDSDYTYYKTTSKQNINTASSLSYIINQQ